MQIIQPITQDETNRTGGKQKRIRKCWRHDSRVFQKTLEISFYSCQSQPVDALITVKQFSVQEAAGMIHQWFKESVNYVFVHKACTAYS